MHYIIHTFYITLFPEKYKFRVCTWGVDVIFTLLAKEEEWSGDGFSASLAIEQSTCNKIHQAFIAINHHPSPFIKCSYVYWDAKYVHVNLMHVWL